MAGSQDSEDTGAGFAFAAAAYVFWGFLPLYLKLLVHLPAVEVVAHRIVWSVPVAALILIALRRTADLRVAVASPRTIGMACVTATLISVNWGIYVWAIAADRTLDAALGYYINPLFSVALGAVLLGERLRVLQVVAIALAVGAVLVLVIAAGVVPWAGLALTVSFGLYAFFKRSLPVGPNQGFLLEVLLLLPFAGGYLIWREVQGIGAMGQGTGADLWLLIGSGVVTAVPLILYGNGAKRLRLSTIAMMQYTAPTMILLIAVFVFAEPFGLARSIAFPMIWVALAVYSYSILRSRRAVS